MFDIEIKRGYEVLPDNNIRFGIRVINNSDAAISDVEVILDYTDSLFELEGLKIHKLGTIPPTVPRTAEYILKPLGCIHQEQIGATILYKDHTWARHTENMNPKEVHCVCPFLKQKKITKSDFLSLSGIGHASETGINFDGVSAEQVVSFLLQTYKGRCYKVQEVSVENGKILYLASESIGEKAYYLLTALIRENEGLTQVMLRAVSNKKPGLNGFLKEVIEETRHIVNTLNSAHEIGLIQPGQVINIIDSVVQRTSFGGGEEIASVNIKDSVVQRSEFKGADEQKKLKEEEKAKTKWEEQSLKEYQKEKEKLSIEREVKKQRGSRKKWALITIIIVILVATLVPMINVAEQYSTTEIQMKTVDYQEQEPYTDTETTYKTETYQVIECNMVVPHWDFEWGDWGTGYSIDVIITNLEDKSISVYYKFGIKDASSNIVGTDAHWISVLPYSKKTVNYNFGELGSSFSYGGMEYMETNYQTIEKCKTVTKTKDVPETQTIIKYRTVSKTRQEPELIKVTKTRMVKQTIIEYLL